mgnify:CR=1 FL=1
MHIRVINSIFRKLFKAEEILSAEKFFRYVNRKKIVVFVPDEHVEKVAEGMSHSGAGIIGNYKMCSFRTSGTGTFKPGKNARPFSGKKTTLNNVSEIKLEMECDPADLNNVIDALLKYHPYEEKAYEVYDFKKRVSKDEGVIINLISGMGIKVLFKRMNSKPEPEKVDTESRLFRIAVTDSEAVDIIDETILDSAKFTGCDGLISLNHKSNKKYRFFKIH